MNNMTLRLQFSGYNQRFRTQEVKSALNAYRNILMRDANGEAPMYRSSEWRRLQRSQEKQRKRENWYKKSGCDSVIFVPASPNSTLKRQYQERIEDAGFKIKVVEQTGTTLKRKLQQSNPFKERVCQRERCMLCRSGGKGDCTAMGVTYEIACNECKCKYVGETSRSAYSRGMEHLQSAETSEERSAMLRHATSRHQAPPNFKMNITGVFRDDAMLRQITESVNIRNTPSDELLNTKKEWNYVSIPRAAITD